MIIINKATELTEVYNFLTDKQVFICLMDCKIGVAEENIKGYTKTNYKIDNPNYYEASKIVEEANKILHPEKSTLEISKIQATTF